MADPSRPNPATNPDDAVVSSDQTQPMVPSTPSGNAQLDAHIATGEAQPEGDPVEYPIATNVAESSRAGASKTANVNVEGPNSMGAEPASKGNVNLRSHTDIADDQMQGIQPDTDPTGIPMDRDVNRPD